MIIIRNSNLVEQKDSFRFFFYHGLFYMVTPEISASKVSGHAYE